MSGLAPGPSLLASWLGPIMAGSKNAFSPFMPPRQTDLETETKHIHTLGVSPGRLELN